MARIPLVDPETASPEARETFNRIEANGARVLNLYRVLAHSPAVMKNAIKLGNSLINKTKLAARLRELAIMRVAALTGSEYEWQQHYAIALNSGLTAEQINSVKLSEDSRIFTDQEHAVLRYTDELTREVSPSQETFDRLRRYFDERSILELTLSIGYWGMLARVLVSLDVELDKGVGSVQELSGAKAQ